MAKVILRAGKITGVVIVAIIVVAVVPYSAAAVSGAQANSLPSEQTKLVIASLAGDEPVEAVAAMDKLLTDFAEHEQMPSAVREIVQKAVEAGKYEAVGAVCRALTKNSSVADNGVWVAMVSALAAVYQGDDAALGAATGHLTANFSGDLRSIEAFREIAYSFRQQKKYAKARQSYQHVLDTWPNGPRVVFSQRGLVLANLALGDTAAASAALDRLLSDYAEDGDFVKCAAIIARAYRKKKQFDTAIRIYDFIAKNRAEDPKAIWLQLELFNIALVNLKDDAKVEAAYETLLGRFGGHDEIAKVVGEAAWAYRKQKRYADSLRVYREVLAKWPDSDSALIAWRGVVFSLIGLDDAEGADTEAARLLADYEGAERVRATAVKMADEFRKKKHYESALELYEYAADNRTDGKQAIVVQRKVVTTNIDLGDEDGASAAMETLETLRMKFAGNKLTKEIYEVGEHYRKRKKYARAISVYQSVLDNNPGTLDQLRTHTAIAQAYVGLGDDTKVKEMLDRICADFAGYERLGRAVYVVGEEYYYKGLPNGSRRPDSEGRKNLMKGLAVWDRITQTDKYPDQDVYTRHTWFSSGLAYRHLGNWPKAVECMEKVVNEWPGYKFHWNAQCWLGPYYEKLVESGSISASEAKPKIKKAYKDAYDKYPNCKLSADIARSLGNIYFKEKDWQKAADCLSRFKEKDPDSRYSREVASKLKQAHEALVD